MGMTVSPFASEGATKVFATVREHANGTSMKASSSLEGDRLTGRLVRFKEYHLAYNICQYLGMRANRVMTAWAVAKLACRDEEPAVAASIVSKFRTCAGVSFAEVAAVAHERKKFKIASLLLEAEPNANRQVETFIVIGNHDAAMKKAIESSDMDLVFLVLTSMIGNRGAAALPSIVRNPVAKDMLLAFCLASETRRDLLAEYYRENPKYNTFLAVLQHLSECEKLKRHLQRQSAGWTMLQEMKVSTIQSAENLAKREPDGQVNVKMLRLQQILIDSQSNFALELKDNAFLSASLSETLLLLWVHNRGSDADELRKQFGVTDKMYCWVKLRAFIRIQDWAAIDALGGITTKAKPAIAPSAFVTSLVKCGRAEHARVYISRVQCIEERMELYIQCDDWQSAATDCKKNGEIGMVGQLRDRAGKNEKALEAIERGLSVKAAESNPILGLFKK